MGRESPAPEQDVVGRVRGPPALRVANPFRDVPGVANENMRGVEGGIRLHSNAMPAAVSVDYRHRAATRHGN